MTTGESQEHEALEAAKSAFPWLHHRPVEEVFDGAFKAGYRAALAAREDTERPARQREKALQAALDGAKAIIELGDRPHPGSGEVWEEETLAEAEAWDDKYSVYELLLKQLDRVVRNTERKHVDD